VKELSPSCYVPSDSALKPELPKEDTHVICKVATLLWDWIQALRAQSLEPLPPTFQFHSQQYDLIIPPLIPSTKHIQDSVKSPPSSNNEKIPASFSFALNVSQRLSPLNNHHNQSILLIHSNQQKQML
jgi:hypothetical protein